MFIFTIKYNNMQIEFGGGNNPRRPSYKQVDIRKFDGISYVCNSWEIDQYISEDSVTEIYSRHFFEHLTHSQALRTLKAWHKILKTGGRVHLICPNMDFHLKQWYNWKNLSEKEKNHCRAGFWGWQKEGDVSAWDLHKSGYDFDKLKELVESKGFAKVKNLDDLDSKHLEVEFFK
jgi:predicted SAM-dependent methyltransferase